MNARQLVRDSLDNPVLIERIPDDADLAGAGVNSGEMIQIALSCEEALGRPLTDTELSHLNTIEDVRRLLGARGTNGRGRSAETS